MRLFGSHNWWLTDFFHKFRGNLVQSVSCRIRGNWCNSCLNPCNLCLYERNAAMRSRSSPSISAGVATVCATSSRNSCR